MRKPLAILTLALVTLTVGASPAGALQTVTPAYIYVYFSDASHTTEIGRMVGHCRHNSNVVYSASGNTSPYFTETLRYWCGPHGPQFEEGW